MEIQETRERVGGFTVENVVFSPRSIMEVGHLCNRTDRESKDGSWKMGNSVRDEEKGAFLYGKKKGDAAYVERLMKSDKLKEEGNQIQINGIKDPSYRISNTDGGYRGVLGVFHTHFVPRWKETRRNYRDPEDPIWQDYLGRGGTDNIHRSLMVIGYSLLPNVNKLSREEFFEELEWKRLPDELLYDRIGHLDPGENEIKDNILTIELPTGCEEALKDEDEYAVLGVWSGDFEEGKTLNKNYKPVECEIQEF